MAELQSKNDSPNHESLIQVHIAEYNAITTRNVYWLVMQQNIGTLLLVSFGIVATIFPWASQKIPARYFFWGVLTAVQASFGGINFINEEIYRNVFYIENELRRTVQRLLIIGSLGEEQIWQYEAFLYKRSNKRPVITDAAPTILASVALIVMGIFSHSSWYELFFLILNMVIIVLLFGQIKRLVALRHKFEKATTLSKAA